jgi:hypothetical protein
MIFEDYAALWATGIREEFIWPHLSSKYHLEESTLYRIVLKQKNVVAETQPELPLQEDKNAVN